MLIQLLRFEFYYQTRQRVFIIALVIFALMGIGYGLNVAVTPDSFANSAYNLTYAVANMSLLATFFVALLCGNAALRDSNAKITELVGATPVSPIKLWASRYISFVSLSLVIFVSGIAALALGFLLRDTGTDVIGPFVLSHYFWPLLTYGLPNILLVSAVVFFGATVTRSQGMTFLSGVLLFVLYFVGSLVFDSPSMAGSQPLSDARLTLVTLLDPFAIADFFTQVSDWTGAERNTRLMSLSGDFLHNRILWISVSVVLLVLSYRLTVSTKWQQVRKKRAPVSVDAQSIKPTSVPAVHNQPNVGVPSLLLCWLSDVKLQSTDIIKSLPFAGLMTLMVILLGSQIVGQIGNGIAGPLFPHTGILLTYINQGLEVFGPLVVIYYAAELVWRARDSRFAPLIDATGANNLAHLLAKSTTLLLIVVLMVSMANLVAMSYQLLRGFYQFDGQLYFSTYYLIGLPLFQLGLLCLFIQTLLNNKYLGLLVSAVVVAILTTSVGAMLGLHHNLVLFAGTGIKVHSQMNGFGHLLTAVNWFSLYWSIVTSILLMLTYGLWQRGTAQSLSARLKYLPVVWGRNGIRGIAVLGLMWASTGSYIFYNTNVLNTYASATDKLDWRQTYERQTRPYASLPLPQVTDIYLETDIFPHQRRAHISGHYWLTNQTSQAIDRLLLSIPDPRANVSYLIHGAKSIEANHYLGTELFELNTPMATGTRIKLEFKLSLSSVGFKNREDDLAVVDNGSFLHHSDTLPQIGYISGNEIFSAIERQKRGLGQRSQIPELPSADSKSDLSVHSISLISYETIVSTAAGQTVVTPGDLVTQWHENGREYFHYRSSAPMPNSFGYMSAKYERYEDKYKQRNITIFHDPKHAYNAQRMTDAAKSALAYLEKHFSPYQHKQLQIVEIPYRGFARAYPGLVAFSEKAGFIGDFSDPDTMDMLSQVTAHEVAHQWFGVQLRGAQIEGENLLIESVAEYASLMVMKEIYGPSIIEQFKRIAMSDYLNGRSGDIHGEVPLHKLIDQRYLRYKKGAVVFLSLAQLIGETQVNQALASLLAEKANDVKKPATSLDLIRHIKQVAPEKYHAQIDDWFTSVVVFNNSIDGALVKKMADGKYKLTLTVTTNKRRYSSPAEFTVEPAGRPITIGVYAAHPSSATEQQTLHLQSHEFDDNQSTLEIIVAQEPRFVVIDPQLMTIDRDLGDNQFELVLSR
jgi:ABC-2 type transport system permease protein